MNREIAREMELLAAHLRRGRVSARSAHLSVVGETGIFTMEFDARDASRQGDR